MMLESVYDGMFPVFANSNPYPDPTKGKAPGPIHMPGGPPPSTPASEPTNPVEYNVNPGLTDSGRDSGDEEPY